MKTQLAIAALVACLLLAATASAQDHEIIAPTPEQASLRDLAFKAFGDGDMETAIVMFERSLSIRELNTTWANLGRARWKMGDCAGAVEAYDKAQVGPGDATQAEIGETLRRYRSQLPETCGQLLLECKGEVEVQVDGGERMACPSEPVWVKVGVHEVTAHFAPTPVTREVQVEGGFVREVILAPAAPAPKVEPKIVEPEQPLVVAPAVEPPADEGSALATFGWSTGGVGVVLLGTVVLLDAVRATPAYDLLRDNQDPAQHDSLKADFEDAQAVNQVLFFSGAGFVALGVTLLLADWLSADESDALSILPWISGDQAGVRVRF